MAEGTITRPHSDSPLIKIINKTVELKVSESDPTLTKILTIGSGGWLNISKAKPETPTGYTLLFAIVRDWNATGTSPKVAFMVTHNGDYLIGTANQVVANLGIAYYYILSKALV